MQVSLTSQLQDRKIMLWGRASAEEVFRARGEDVDKICVECRLCSRDWMGAGKMVMVCDRVLIVQRGELGREKY